MVRQTLKSGILVISLLLSASTAFAQTNPQAISMYNLGLSAYKQGSPESAIIFFKRACDIDPNLADAQYNLGMIYQSEKRYKEAIPRFIEVLRIKPIDADAHFQLGLVYLEQNQLVEAKQHFSSIPPNSPHFPEAQNHLAQINSSSSNSVSNNADAAGQMQSQPLQTQQNFEPVTQNPVQTTDLSPYGQNTASAIGQPTVSTPPAQVNEVHTPVAIAANTSLNTYATGFHAPSGIAFDHNGHLYVANFLNNTIERVNADGTHALFIGGSSLKGPIGLVADDSGNLYVANYNAGNISKITPAGIATVIATGFRKPYYLSLDRDGNLYVSQQENNSIVKIMLPHQDK